MLSPACDRCPVDSSDGSSVFLLGVTIMPDQPALARESAFEVGSPLDRAVRYAAGEVSLPIHPLLSDGDIDRVVQVIEGWEARC